MPLPAIHISTTAHDAVLVITVLDSQLNDEAQVEAWRLEMEQAIQAAAPAGVVIDMRNVEYMTSVAMFPLISTRTAAEQLGAQTVLCNLSPGVLKVLTVTQLIVESRPHVSHLTMAETLEDALALLSKEQD